MQAAVVSGTDAKTQPASSDRFRVVGPVGAIGIIVASMVGSGIFTLTGKFGAKVGTEENVPVEVKRGARLLRFVLPVTTRRAVTGVRWVGSEKQRERLSEWLGASFTLSEGDPLDLGPFDNFHGSQNVI